MSLLRNALRNQNKMDMAEEEEDFGRGVDLDEEEDSSSEEALAKPEVVAPRVVKGKKKRVKKAKMFVPPPAAAAAAAPSASAPPSGGGGGGEEAAPVKINGELDRLPEVAESELHTIESVIRKADVSGPTSDKKLRQIQKLFNLGRDKLMMVESRVTGHFLEPGNVKLIHINNVPEMVTPLDGPREFKTVMKTLDVREVIGIFKESKLIYGAKGMWVANVPQGKYLCCWDGTQPLILDEGTHVLNAPNLQPVTHKNEVDQSSLYIKVGNTHILRVPPGKLALIMLNNEPFVLESRVEPYVFKNPVFAFDPKRDFVAAGSPYIRHGDLHMLQVPKGKIAACWQGSVPFLLHYRPERFLIKDSLFSVAKKGVNQMFYASHDEYIVHGSIKRIVPRTGNVAVVYENGHLRIVHPTETGAPITFNSEQVVVKSLFNTQKRTIRFPSEKTKLQHEKDVKVRGGDPKFINYEQFTTGSGGRYGMKVIVVFEVADPLKALTYLKEEEIVPHVELLVVTEMNKAIQTAETANFLQSKGRTGPTTAAQRRSQIRASKMTGQGRPPKNPHVTTEAGYGTLQDEIKDNLTRDLREIGIHIDRVSIEEALPIDPELIEQMANFAIRSKRITMDVALLSKQGEIWKKKTEAEAMMESIIKENEYELMIEEAENKLEMARWQAEADKAIFDAQIAGMKQIAEILESNPELLKLQMAQSVYGKDSVFGPGEKSEPEGIVDPEFDISALHQEIASLTQNHEIGDDWEECFDHDTGRVYYKNHTQKTTTFQRPKDFKKKL